MDPELIQTISVSVGTILAIVGGAFGIYRSGNNPPSRSNSSSGNNPSVGNNSSLPMQLSLQQQSLQQQEVGVRIVELLRTIKADNEAEMRLLLQIQVMIETVRSDHSTLAKLLQSVDSLYRRLEAVREQLADHHREFATHASTRKEADALLKALQKDITDVQELMLSIKQELLLTK